jgi:hypothetical protein
MSAGEVAERLERCGIKRRELEDARLQLEDETARALRDARGVLTMRRAHALAGIGRSTAYALLAGRGDKDGAAVHGGPGPRE